MLILWNVAQNIMPPQVVPVLVDTSSSQWPGELSQRPKTFRVKCSFRFRPNV